MGRDTGKWSHPLATGWNQQFRDLPYKHLNWFVVHKGELVGEKPAQRAPFVGISWSAFLGAFLSHSGGMDAEDIL